jgi:hypothetical protein
MNKTDELLNSYIDGELQSGELEEVQLLLKIEDNVKRLKALRVVDDSLRTLESDSAPAGFTAKVMKSISAGSTKIKLSKNYFASSINIIFVVSILAIIAFIFSQANLNYTASGIDSKVNDTVNMINQCILPLLTFFKNKSVMFFGSSFSLILLLGAYYFIEDHKTFKKRIESLTSK